MGVSGNWGDLIISNGNGSMRTEAPSAPHLANLVEPAKSSGKRTAEWTGIPSGVSYILMTFDRVTAAVSHLVQIGDSGGYETSGYSNKSRVNWDGGNETKTDVTNGFGIRWRVANGVMSGGAELRRFGSNRWMMTYLVSGSADGAAGGGIGFKTLSASLDRIKLVAGANAADGRVVGLAWQ